MRLWLTILWFGLYKRIKLNRSQSPHIDRDVCVCVCVDGRTVHRHSDGVRVCEKRVIIAPQRCALIGTSAGQRGGRARSSRNTAATPTPPRMSGITGNLDCDECLSSAHVSNSTELRGHPAADEDDELLRYIWTEYLHPKQYEWVLIVAYIIVFFVSLIGNSLGEL